MSNKLNEGETLFADGKIDEAEACFLSLVESGYYCKEAYNNLGVIAFQKNDKEKAIDYFTKALEIDQLPIAIPLLEKIAEQNQDDKEVIQLLDEIRDLLPSNV